MGFVTHAGVGVSHHREHSGDDGRGEGGSVDAGGCGGGIGSQGEGFAGGVDVHGGAATSSVRAEVLPEELTLTLGTVVGTLLGV